MSKQKFNRFGLFDVNERAMMSRKRPVKNKHYKRVRPDGLQVHGRNGEPTVFGASAGHRKGFPQRV